MRRHLGGIDAASLKYPNKALHAEPAARAKTGADGFFRHAHAPIQTRDCDVLAFAVIAYVGNRAAGFGHLDGVLESLLTPQSLDCGIYTCSIREFHNSSDRVFPSVIDNRVGAIDTRQLLAFRHRVDADY